MNKQTIDYLLKALPESDISCQFTTNIDILQPSSLHDVLPALLRDARDSSFGRRLVESIVLKTPFVVSHKGVQIQLECLFSLMTSPLHNVVVARLDETVILIGQHVTSADFIYVPEHALLAKLYHTSDDGAAEVLGHFKAKLMGSVFAALSQFGGVIASHGRPSHFFYDTALSVHNIYENFQYPEPLPMYQLHAGDFVHFSEIYGEAYFSRAGLVSFQEINQMAIEQGKLFIKLGAFHRHHDKKATALLNRFDDFLQSAAKRWAEREQSSLLALLQVYKEQGYFVVWHGIATEKRRWLDQVEAIILLVEQLQTRGEKVCLVLDGWTIPESHRGKTFAQIQLDIEVVDVIKAQLPRDVPCLSVVGETALCKTAVAMMLDFHVSNGATGSLYVSRVAKKTGVLHLGNVTKVMTQNTLHYNSFFVPESLVVDAPSDAQARIDYVSYSISPQDFVLFALQVLDDKASC